MIQTHSRTHHKHRHHKKKDVKDVKVTMKLSGDDGKKEDKEKAKKEHESTIKELKVHMADPKEVEQIKKDVKE